MPDKVAIFIDGGYLRKINPARTDYAKLINALVGSNSLHRAYYYDCAPYMPSNPTLADNTRFANAKKFLQSISRIPRLDVRLGKLRLKGYQTDGKPIFQQKRVDLMLGLDIASVVTVLPRIVESIILLSGDGDLLPAIETARNAHIITILAHGDAGTYDKELWGKVDERILLNTAFFKKVL